MFLIIDDQRRRLCRDHKWRSHAHFGDYKECVRTYKVLPSAKKRAVRVKGKVLEVSGTLQIDAGGNIWDEVETKPGFIKSVVVDLFSLIVWEDTPDPILKSMAESLKIGYSQAEHLDTLVSQAIEVIKSDWAVQRNIDFRCKLVTDYANSLGLNTNWTGRVPQFNRKEN